MQSYVFALFACFLFIAVPADAQSLDRVEDIRSNVAYFYHARPGEATVQISVWGTVPRPGIYEVPLGTNLDKLLTMTGGIPDEARQEDQERRITVRLFRQNSDQRRLIYEAPIEDVLVNTGQYPDLEDDDVLVVETLVERRFSWRDGLTVVGGIATVALALERVIRLITR